MSADILARPLAARVAGLPPVDDAAVPEIASVQPAVMQAAVQALDAGHTHYTDRPGILPLREKAVARLAARYGVEYGPDEVTITCGATEARFVAVRQLAGAGRKILHAGDASAIAGAAALAGASLTENADDADIAVLYLTHAAPEADARRLAELAGTRGWWIIFDAAAGGTGTFHPARLASLAPLTVTIDSASDALPGWRVGWLAGSKAAGKLRAYKQSMTICSTSISQWAALGLEDAHDAG
jgi:aspartate/methionine/tyrosine aminotransferase